MATADKAVYSAITGGLLVRVEGADGLIRPLLRPTSSNSLVTAPSEI